MRKIITGKILRSEGNRVFVQEGNAVASYNLDYYVVFPRGGEILENSPRDMVMHEQGSEIDAAGAASREEFKTLDTMIWIRLCVNGDLFTKERDIQTLRKTYTLEIAIREYEALTKRKSAAWHGN
ncbi:hypothetical protein [Paenibacillus eucommiae]|uniref:Uncharacterized protein n=1 Tax=Paenibacillus eucommiae TaxID=1355755 RepID=A0ABS4IY69_9BACL|nr:hypothetical protein [Paenibacillus eucommiae]MBP1992523.1 hypothetical protein [Paenibacillus eucommiae]